MVSQTTIDTINYIKDVDTETNIKLVILGLLFIYSVFLFWYSYKWENKEYWAKIIKTFIMKFPSLVFLVSFPLFSIFLFRTVSWEVVYTLLISYFTYVLVILLISAKVGFGVYALEMLGLKQSVEKIEFKVKK